MSFETTIRKWFTIHVGGSLVLPDGWYGRPYDNQQTLVSISEEPRRLTLVLASPSVSLSFEGLRSINEGIDEIVFASFDKLVFESENTGTRVYSNGIVKVVSAPGQA